MININQMSSKRQARFSRGIKEFGADALRFNFCAMASTGRDINFDLKELRVIETSVIKFGMHHDLYTHVKIIINENLNSKDSNIFDKWIL